MLGLPLELLHAADGEWQDYDQDTPGQVGSRSTDLAHSASQEQYRSHQLQNVVIEGAVQLLLHIALGGIVVVLLLLIRGWEKLL